jgi:hypothetical protein
MDLGVEALAPRSRLEITRERFIQADPRWPLAVGCRFDLAISLETGEHLPEITGQGGTGRLNEQWPDYGARLFAGSGFESVDVLRPLTWNSDRSQSGTRRRRACMWSALGGQLSSNGACDGEALSAAAGGSTSAIVPRARSPVDRNAPGRGRGYGVGWRA